MGQRQKEALHIPTMIFCIIGVVLAVFGFLLMKNENFKLNIISAEGTVTSIQTKTNADGVVESRTINLNYMANKSNYSATIPTFTDDVQIGDRMTLYYDILSPESVSSERRGYIGYLSLIIGAIVAVTTGPRFIKIIKDNYL